MSTSNDILKLFAGYEKQESNGGFFSNLRNNRHVEKLLMKVNQNFNKGKGN